MKLKNAQVVFIGEDGQPSKDSEGNLKIDTLYRAFPDETSYSETIKSKAGNAIKKASDFENQLNDFKMQQKNSEISNLYNELNINTEFIDLLDSKIDKSKDLENIKSQLTNLITEKPSLKKQINSGGIPVTKTVEPDKKQETNTNSKIIFDGINPRNLKGK